MKFVAFAAFASALALAGAADATTVIVDAQANSSSGGVGADTGLNLVAGQTFTVSVPLTDLWSAGALPRWSNANGLNTLLYATGSDESGQPAGTEIGSDFGLWTQNGLSAPYGALVGEIGGVFQLLGANFNGAAWGTGQLKLYYWDSNSGDNVDFITATLSAIPEPATWAMMITGFGLAGVALRRRRAVAA